MKSIINKSILFAIVLIWTAGCKNDETKVSFQGGTAPVLTVSSTADIKLELDSIHPQRSSIQFQWTNPNYQFSNGASTQDVYYTLQIDTAGLNFTNPKFIAELAFTNEVFKAFTIKELDDFVAALELRDHKLFPFEFRIKAAMASNSVALYSNVIKINISTYLDAIYPPPASLYIVGDATPSGWSNDSSHPDATQTFTKVNSYTFQLNSLTISSNHFLFLPVKGSWDHKYAFSTTKDDKDKNQPIGDKFTYDGTNDFLAPAAGKYKIVVNFKTGKYTLTKL